MRDGLGNEISERDKVVWVGGKTQYAGVRVYTVEKICSKQLKIIPERGMEYTYVFPDCVVVVNDLLEK